jgi:hypothetical protein
MHPLTRNSSEVYVRRELFRRGDRINIAHREAIPSPLIQRRATMDVSRDPKGDLAHAKRKAAEGRSQAEPETVVSASFVNSSIVPDNFLGRAFRHFCTFNHGYLKVKRDVDGSRIHLTYTFIYGTWARHYVYVAVDYAEIEWGLQLLAGKVWEVDEGVRKPTPDRLPFE